MTDWWNDDGAEGEATTSPDASEVSQVQPEGNYRSMDLADIAEFRRENKVAYFKDAAMQKHELALLEAQESVAVSPDKPWYEPTDKPWWDDSQPDAQHDSEYDAGQELIAVSDLPLDMQPAHEFADSVLAEDAMSTETLEAFATELSPAAQDALIEELGLPPDMDAAPATDEQLTDFQSTDEGATVVEEWGHRALEKLGIVRQRWNRLRNNMPEHERETFDALFDSLPPAAVEQAYRLLAG